MQRRISANSKWVRAAALTFLLCAAVTWSACQSVDEEKPPAAAVHAVESERLDRVMRTIEAMDRALLPQEIDVHAVQQRQRETIALLAAVIAQSAEYIPSALDNEALPPEFRNEFVRLTQDLKDHAQKLRAAPAMSTAALKTQVQAMRASCIDCHTRFRVLPAVR